MLFKNPVKPNLIASLLFIALAGISFTATAAHHGDAAEKAKEAAAVELEKSPADKAAMKTVMKEDAAAKVAEVKDVEAAADDMEAEAMEEVEAAADDMESEDKMQEPDSDG